MQVKHLVDYRLKRGSDLGTENDFSNVSPLSEYPTKRPWGEGGLPYITCMDMCLCEGCCFQAV